MKILARIVLGGVFVWAGLSHLFRGSALSAATMLDETVMVGSWGYYGFVAGEFALAIWLLSGWRDSWSALAAVIVLAAYSGAIAFEWTKDRPLPCGCMGSAGVDYDFALIRKGLALAFWRNAALIVPAGWLFLRGPAGVVRPLIASAATEEIGK